MKIDMEFKGLEELVKAFESAASDEDIAQVNKTIAEKGEPVVQRIMSGKIPKSKDIKRTHRTRAVISTSVLLTGERFTDRHKSSYMQQAGRQMQNCKR